MNILAKNCRLECTELIGNFKGDFSGTYKLVSQKFEPLKYAKIDEDAQFHIFQDKDTNWQVVFSARTHLSNELSLIYLSRHSNEIVPYYLKIVDKIYLV